jgi:CheY-like chemotaxis protein
MRRIAKEERAMALSRAGEKVRGGTRVIKRPATDLDAGWDDVPQPDSEPGRRPTPWPSFDLAAFARESETSLKAADASEGREKSERADKPTAPPPPFHPASLRAPSRVRSIVEAITASLHARILECTDRTQLVRTQLRIGGLSREEAARALVAELGALEWEAARNGSSIAQLTVALRTMIEELAGLAGQSEGVQFDVVILDESAETRARVALAVESIGHVARGASSLSELAILAARRMPDAIFVAAASDGARQPEICALLREVVRSDSVAVVLFATARDSNVEQIAREAGATRSFRAYEEIEVMKEELRDVFGALLCSG